jgi:hypothetical protein
MMTVGKTDHFTLSGWSAVGALVMMVLTKVIAALVLAWPLAWLASAVFGGGSALHAIFGDHLSYWRCVGLLVIWHVARLRIRFSGPSQIQIEGDR